MTGWQILTTAWEFDPSIVIGCIVVMAAYLWMVRCRLDRQTFYFASGVGTTFLALVSPIDALGDDYLFSAHMFQHILLDMVAPPLFIVGLPASVVQQWLRYAPVARTERILGHPVVAWWLGTAVLWVWHLPAWYNATLESEPIHIAEHLSFLVSGTILWWPVLAPVQELRLPSLGSVIYLLLASLPNALLGIIFTVASTPFYSGYEHPKDELGRMFF